uniref:Ig-like domain-containing protein n=1 Tax=Labrus bergylta TaxID=56723 RepID=A0A3Q3ERV3_9LABR
MDWISYQWVLLIMINISMTTGVWSEIRLEQSPSEVKRPGETVKMSCIISGFDMTSTISTGSDRNQGELWSGLGG